MLVKQRAHTFTDSLLIPWTASHRHVMLQRDDAFILRLRKKRGDGRMSKCLEIDKHDYFKVLILMFKSNHV